MGDFNNPNRNQSLGTLALSPLNTETTSFKNSKNPSCINLLLTNFKPSFIETGIFDHHKIISILL